MEGAPMSRRLLVVGLPLVLLVLPIIFTAFLVAFAIDAVKAGWGLYEGFSRWMNS